MVPGEPLPSDPSAQAWLLPSDQALSVSGYQGPGRRAFLEARARSPRESDRPAASECSKREQV